MNKAALVAAEASFLSKPKQRSINMCMGNREFYRPHKEGVRIEYPEGLTGAEIHRYENGSLAPNSDTPFAAVFGWVRDKPDWERRFSSPELREEKIAEWIEEEKARLAKGYHY